MAMVLTNAVPAKGKWLTMAMAMAMVVPAQGNNFIAWWRLREWDGSLYFV